MVCFSSPRALASCNETAPFCAEGHHGVKCSRCERHYYATTGGACLSCAGDASNGLVAISSSAAGLIIAFILFVQFGSGKLHHALKKRLVMYYPIIFDVSLRK